MMAYYGQPNKSDPIGDPRDEDVTNDDQDPWQFVFIGLYLVLSYLLFTIPDFASAFGIKACIALPSLSILFGLVTPNIIRWLRDEIRYRLKNKKEV